MEKILEAGQIVQVYQDPLTSQKLEGQAKLIKRADNSVYNGCEYWYVRFINEKGEYIRLIKQP